MHYLGVAAMRLPGMRSYSTRVGVPSSSSQSPYRSVVLWLMFAGVGEGLDLELAQIGQRTF